MTGADRRRTSHDASWTIWVAETGRMPEPHAWSAPEHGVWDWRDSKVEDPDRNAVGLMSPTDDSCVGRRLASPNDRGPLPLTPLRYEEGTT